MGKHFYARLRTLFCRQGRHRRLLGRALQRAGWQSGARRALWWELGGGSADTPPLDLADQDGEGLILPPLSFLGWLTVCTPLWAQATHMLSPRLLPVCQPACNWSACPSAGPWTQVFSDWAGLPKGILFSNPLYSSFSLDQISIPSRLQFPILFLSLVTSSQLLCSCTQEVMK